MGKLMNSSSYLYLLFLDVLIHLSTSSPTDENGYYSGFADPKADMVVEVKDGVRFRVQLCVLRTQSAFFRDVPDYSEELSGQSEKLVHLNVDPSIFAKLLDFLDKGPTPTRELHWTILRQIAEIGVRYQFESLPHLIAGAAVRLLHLAWESPPTRIDAWTVLKFAAQNHLPDLAKYAITFFITTYFATVEGLLRHGSCDTFSDIPGNYTAALLRAMMQVPLGSGADHDDWKTVSGLFNPEG